jgi:hypothetical protein
MKHYDDTKLLNISAEIGIEKVEGSGHWGGIGILGGPWWTSKYNHSSADS